MLAHNSVYDIQRDTECGNHDFFHADFSTFTSCALSVYSIYARASRRKLIAWRDIIHDTIRREFGIPSVVVKRSSHLASAETRCQTTVRA